MMPRAAAHLCYRLQERLMGRPTFAALRQLEESQWWPRARLEALQAERLNRLLDAAAKHAPWHAARIRAAGLAEKLAAGAVTLDDLRLLPTMDKQDVRQHLNELVWRDIPGGAFKYNTGGSSGEPLIFYFGRERQAADAACRMRARRWWGVAPGDREAYLWGAPTELKKTDRIKILRDRMVNHLVLNAFAMTPQRMDDYAATLESWQPASIYGYASSVALLAEHLEARGRPPRLHRLKVVCTTGEPLYAHQREQITRVFQVPVANEYGCRDGGLVAHEAPGGQLLTMSEFMITELLDPAGNPVAPGEPGEVVLTNLASSAQAFIRYRTGDVATASATAAVHGQGLHVLADIAGRTTDFVLAADGTVMHALAVIYEIRGVDGVVQFKCVQHSLLEFEVQLVVSESWQDRGRLSIERGLKARLGQSVRIRIVIVDEIPPAQSGKHRYVVSHVPVDAAR